MDRNYKIVETLRQQNLREQRRLDESVGGRFGMKARHQTKLAEVTREQLLLKEELAKIRATGTTTWGVLPPRETRAQNGQTNHQPAPAANGKAPEPSRAQREKKREEKRMSQLEEKMTMFNRGISTEIHNGLNGSASNGKSQSDGGEKREMSLREMNINDGGATNGVTPSSASSSAQRKVSTTSQTMVVDSTTKTTQSNHAATKQSQKGAIPNRKYQHQKKSQDVGFNEQKYNPDGSLRTVHVMPDFASTWSEAKKARYVRHREKPEHEQELSVGEMFAKDRK